MGKGSTVYILESMVTQDDFTDGFGEHALVNSDIVGVYADIEDAERELEAREQIEAQLRKDCDTDSVFYVITAFRIQ